MIKSMEYLFELDRMIFLWINHFPHTSYLQTIALFLSGIGSYGFVWFILGFYMFLREEIKDHTFYLLFLLSGLAGYLFVEFILKPGFGRMRPGELIGAIVTSSDLSTSFSFPSGHATMAFALASILAYKEKKLGVFFYILAFFIALSRVYLGKHYPSDVLAGSLIGYCIGRMCIYVYTSGLFHRILKNTKTRKRKKEV